MPPKTSCRPPRKEAGGWVRGSALAARKKPEGYRPPRHREHAPERGLRAPPMREQPRENNFPRTIGNRAGATRTRRRTPCGYALRVAATEARRFVGPALLRGPFLNQTAPSATGCSRGTVKRPGRQRAPHRGGSVQKEDASTDGVEELLRRGTLGRSNVTGSSQGTRLLYDTVRQAARSESNDGGGVVRCERVHCGPSY